MGLEEWYFGYLKNAFIPRYLLTLYRVHRVYHISFYSHFVQNKQSFITKKYSLYIVGEVRSGEAFDLLTAFNTGHSGMGTGHANSPKDMLSRLESMVLMAAELPLMAIRSQISAAIDIIVQLGRLRDKSRRVLEIVELKGMEQGEILLNPLYVFQEKPQEEERKKGGKSGKKTAAASKETEKVKGELVRVGQLLGKEKLWAAGCEL